MDTLWTPWRMGYVGGERATGCIFCDKPAANDDRANLILHRGTNAFVIMNLFPYNTGHVMIVPYAHVSTLTTLPAAALAEMTALLPWVTGLLERTLRPHGFNVGLNIGSVAGAGIGDHLHMHVVPRWGGDANFMPILANTMVLPELIPVTQAKLLGEIARTPYPHLTDDPAVAEQAGGVVFDASGRIALRRAKKGDASSQRPHRSGRPAATAAIREVAEEMGLATRLIDWLGDYRFTFKKDRHVGYFLCTSNPTSPTSPRTRAPTPPSPADALARLTFDNDRALVQHAIARHTAITAQGNRQ
ncbi:MAG: HIT domain-containing protein [Chloroflexia bacterium]